METAGVESALAVFVVRIRKMAATRDRNGLHTDGRQQAFPVDGRARVYRHTFVGMNSSGYLRKLADTLGFTYVGVSAAAIWPTASPGRGTTPRDRLEPQLAPVIQWGELEFRFQGTLLNTDLGQVAYAVDDDTVTTDPSALVGAYAVGRVTKRSPSGDGYCRVLIDGFPCCCPDRVKIRLNPHTYVNVEAGNWRIGVTLPYAFEDVTYAAKLLCSNGDVVCNEDTGPKLVGKAYWNIFVPTATAGDYGVSLTFTPWLAGEGWTGPRTVPQSGTWDALVELV